MDLIAAAAAAAELPEKEPIPTAYKRIFFEANSILGTRNLLTEIY